MPHVPGVVSKGPLSQSLMRGREFDVDSFHEGDSFKNLTTFSGHCRTDNNALKL